MFTLFLLVLLVVVILLGDIVLSQLHPTYEERWSVPSTLYFIIGAAVGAIAAGATSYFLGQAVYLVITDSAIGILIGLAIAHGLHTVYG